MATSDLFSRILAGTPSARAPGGHDHVVGHHRIGADGGAAADHGPMEDDAARAGQRFVLEGAALQVGQVSDHAAVADDGGESGAGVDDGAVLDGGTRAPTVMVP